MTPHQQKQREIVSHIEEQITSNSLQFSTVSPVEDYANDARICLTSVHLPSNVLLSTIEEELLNPLKKVDPTYYYYSPDSLHMTIKNIRVISDPPHFTYEEIGRAEKVFSQVIPSHHKFSVYFYRLLLFPNNLALIGTTGSELDNIILDLDRGLKEVGLGDDKKYINEKYFFSNMTLARFPTVSKEFQEKVQELSAKISFDPYVVDSVTLLSANAVLQKRKIIHTWKLQ